MAKAKTIQSHAQDLANAWIAKNKAEMTICDTIIKFIKPRTMTETANEDYLKFFKEAMLKSDSVSEKSVGTYVSQVKRIIKLAINHKDEVLKLGENAGNLNQWYNACGDNKKPERNKNPKVSTPKPTDAPKLGEEDKQPSGGRDFVKEFKTVAQEMLAGGMTAEQLHAMIEELTVAKAA